MRTELFCALAAVLMLEPMPVAAVVVSGVTAAKSISIRLVSA